MEKIKKILKKNLVALIAIAVLLAGAGTVYGGLKVQQEDKGVDPTAADNPQKTQVLLEGQGYSLTKEQKQQYDLPQKIEKKEQKQIKKYTPTTYPNRKYPYNTVNPANKKLNYAPTIYTNLKNKSVTAGSKLTFWVEGKSYTRASIAAKNYSVKLGKTTIKAEDTSSVTHANYSTTKIKEGKNTITIKVTDPLRKKSTSKKFTITGTKKKTYTVTAKFSAPDLYYKDSKGFSKTVKCTLKEGDDRDAVLKAVDEALSDDGYSATWSGSSLINLKLPSEAYTKTKTEIVEEAWDEPVVDDEGNPVLDDEGNPTYIHHDAVTKEVPENPSNEVKSSTFGGTWYTDGVPESVTKNTTITCIYE